MSPECEYNGDGGKGDNSLLFLSVALRNWPVVLTKSQLPEMKVKKAEGLKQLVRMYETNLGKTISVSQLAKKIHNMKARLKFKTNKNKTGDKKIKLHEWEKNLYALLLEADTNPIISKKTGVDSNNCKISEEAHHNFSADVKLLNHKKSLKTVNQQHTTEDLETQETSSLSTPQLQRLVLLEQLKTTRIQRRYYLEKMQRHRSHELLENESEEEQHS